MTTRITISRDGVWAGNGRVVDGAIVDCAAVLGPDQDASDETYEAIEEAIDDEERRLLDGRPVRSGSVQRPDGAYGWTTTRMCDVCEQRPATISESRGWNPVANMPAYAGVCEQCKE